MAVYAKSASEITVNSTVAGDQSKSSITRLTDGSIIVVWQSTNTTQDGNGTAVLMRRYSANGIALTAETVVNSANIGDQLKPQVSALASGGYVVTWETTDTAQDGNGTAIKGKIFDAAGLAISPEFKGNNLAIANQQQPTVAGLADGTFVIIWHTTDISQDGAGWALKGQRFSSTGGLLGSEFRVNTSAFGSQNNADVAVLNDGRFVVSWQHGSTGSSEVHAQIFNADGMSAGGQIYVGSGAGEFDSSVAALADGGFVITYHRLGGIFFQRYNADRTAAGATVSVGAGTVPEVSALTEGGFVIAWRASASATAARTFSASGAAVSNAFTLAMNVNQGAETSIVSLAGGGFAATWSDGLSGVGNEQEIRFGIFQPQVNVAPELGAATKSISVAENLTAVATIVATDEGAPGPIVYSVAGGADAALFNINATTGALSFFAPRNFESPADTGANNVYDVVIKASDGDLFDTQAISVNITNVNEVPVITSNGAGPTATISVNENNIIAANVSAIDVDGNS